MDIFTIFTEMGHPFEAIKAMRVSLLSYFIEDGVCSIIAVYIDISCLTWMKLGVKTGELVGITNEEKSSQYAEKYFLSFLIHIEYLMVIKSCQS